MYIRIHLIFSLLIFLLTPLVLQGSRVFPFDYKVEELENGLKVISIPLKNPHIISYYTIVRSGSRNEIEPGKSGFAHFFEHMMFKGTKKFPPQIYNNILTKLGAGTNGYTTDDYTCYYIVFAGRENLEKVVEIESDRFINLYYNEEMIKTESSVIEGEYYTSISDPSSKIYELLRDTAFEKHSYKHTTMGYLEDILDMPHQYEFSLVYKKRFYAPNNTILLVAGDFDHEELMKLIKKYYSSWEKSDYELITPVEPPQEKAKRLHYDWPSQTLPRLCIGFKGPAYSDERIDKAALDLLAQVAFSEQSPIYQKLVIEEQKCLTLSADFTDRRDPYLLIFSSIIKNEGDLDYVEGELFREFERLMNESIDEKLLDEVKSNMKYSFAHSIGTTDGIASQLAFYINLKTNPMTVNMLFDLYDKITVQNVQQMAKKYFQRKNSTVITITGSITK